MTKRRTSKGYTTDLTLGWVTKETGAQLAAMAAVRRRMACGAKRRH
ncbi:hypothetical protein [Providencia sp. PROV224]|nr:hypothetical protein [Providencia sp. PROV224]